MSWETQAAAAMEMFWSPMPVTSQTGFVLVPVMMVPVFVPRGQEQPVNSGPVAASPFPSLPLSPTTCGSYSHYRDSGSTDATTLQSDEDGISRGRLSKQPSSPTGSSRMVRIAERFMLTASKASKVDERNEQVAQNTGTLATPSVQLSFPDLGFSVRGVAEVRSFFIDFFNMVPDLQLTLSGIAEDGPKHGALVYIISGTQQQPFMPMFPVGKWVEWQFTARFEFDRDSKIRLQEMRFDIPSASKATAAHFEGLAQCFHMLANTAGGSRLVQKSLEMEAVDDRGQTLLLNSMHGNVWDLALSPHGNHIVQKIVTNFLPLQVQFIVDAFQGRVEEAARNQMQSRILERLLEYCPPQQTASLVEEALLAAPMLLLDAYGNFVMQALLEHCAAPYRTRLVGTVCREADRFSRDKIASNTVRKALRHGSVADQTSLIAALRADEERFANLGKHKIGSFVANEVRRVLKNSLK